MIPNHHNYLFEKKLLYNFPKRELVLRTQQGAQVRLITHLFEKRPQMCGLVWRTPEGARVRLIAHLFKSHPKV